MKGVLFLLVFGFMLVGLNGCYTIPHHFAEGDEYDEEIFYYPPPPPHPYPPDPPYPRPPYIPNPPSPDPQPKISHPETPKDNNGSSYGVRDPLRGHGGRGTGERTSDLVHKPERNDGGRR